MPIEVGLQQRIVPLVSVEIQALRVIKMSVRHRLWTCAPVRTQPSSHAGAVVPCAELVEAGFRIAFFAGEFVILRTVVDADVDLLTEWRVISAVADRGLRVCDDSRR